MSVELRATVGVAAALIFIHLAGFLFPGSLNWGFHFLGFLPWHYAILYIVAAAWIALFVFRGKPEELVEKLGELFDRSPIQFLLGTLVLLISCAVLLRIQAPLLGDGFYLLKNYTEASRGISPLYPRDEPLATYYFSFMLKVIGASTYEEYLNAFLIADILLGIGFILSIMFIAKNLWKEPKLRILAFIFLLVLPCAQLFFGYVETYPFVLFALSLYLCLAIAYFNGTVPFYVVPSAFLFMAISHYLSGLLAFSLLYASYCEYRKKNFVGLGLGYGIAGAICLVLLMIIRFDIQRFSSWVPYSHFLSVVMSSDPMENYAQAYTLFSPYHAVDLVNLFLLLGAFPMFMIVSKLKRTVRMKSLSPPTIFLAIAAVPVVCFLLVVKFDLGAARDWDVFSPYALIAGILAASIFFTAGEPHAVRSYCLIILVTLLNSFFFYLVNSDAEASVKRYMSFFDRRTLSQNGYYGASLQLAMCYHETHKLVDPLKLWNAYADSFPGDNRGYENIINILSREKNEAGIIRVYEKWYAYNPDNPSMLEKFKRYAFEAGNRNFSNGNLPEAATYYSVALRLDPDDPKACNNLGSVFAEQHKLDQAIAMFGKAIALDSLYADALYNMGDACIDNGAKEKGIGFLKRAARLGNGEARHDLSQLKVSW